MSIALLAICAIHLNLLSPIWTPPYPCSKGSHISMVFVYYNTPKLSTSTMLCIIYISWYIFNTPFHRVCIHNVVCISTDLGNSCICIFYLLYGVCFSNKRLQVPFFFSNCYISSMWNCICSICSSDALNKSSGWGADMGGLCISSLMYSWFFCFLQWSCCSLGSSWFYFFYFFMISLLCLHCSFTAPGI